MKVRSLVLAVAFAAPALGAVAAAPAAHAEGSAPYQVQRFTTNAQDDPALARAWHAWKAGHHRRYTTVVQQSCECLERPPVRTEVRGNQVRSVTYQGEDEQLARTGYEMDELFRLLRDGYRNADAVDVHYRRGVPRSIYIDWDAGLADEETVLSVRIVGADEAEQYDYAITPFRPRTTDRPALKQAWHDWRANGYAHEYATTVRRSAGEGQWPTIRTVVDHGVVLRIERADDNAGDLPDRGWEMDRLFRLIRSLYKSADEVHVTWTSDGVPRRISADPIAEAVDDEFVMTVKVGGVALPE